MVISLVVQSICQLRLSGEVPDPLCSCNIFQPQSMGDTANPAQGRPWGCW